MRMRPEDLQAGDQFKLDDAVATVLGTTRNHADFPNGRVVARVRNRLGAEFDIGIPAPVTLADGTETPLD